jgi:hypothetical protein
MPMTNAQVGPTIHYPEEPMQISGYRYLLEVADLADRRAAKDLLRFLPITDVLYVILSIIVQLGTLWPF